jgi:hypothetical protein
MSSIAITSNTPTTSGAAAVNAMHSAPLCQAAERDRFEHACLPNETKKLLKRYVELDECSNAAYVLKKEPDVTVVLLGEDHRGGYKLLKGEILDRFNYVGCESPQKSLLYKVYCGLHKVVDAVWLGGEIASSGLVRQAKAKQQERDDLTLIELETRDEFSCLDNLSVFVSILTLCVRCTPPFMCICGPCCYLSFKAGVHPVLWMQGKRNENMAKNIDEFCRVRRDSTVLLAVMGAAHVKPIAGLLSSDFNYKQLKF